MIANTTVMPNVGPSHNHAMVTNVRHRTALDCATTDGDMFANNRIVPHNDTGVLVLIPKVLWVATHNST
jgi:hypothetical protein